jgi:hypothetical protein
MPLRFRFRTRTALIAIVFVSVGLVGIRLWQRWTYHRLLAGAVGQYERMARSTRDTAVIEERLAIEASKAGATAAKKALSHQQNAALYRRQSVYYDGLAQMSRRGAARPWYESSPIELPASLGSPPGGSAPGQ